MKPRMVLTLLPFLFAITVPAFSQQTSSSSAAAQQSAAPQQPDQSAANSPAVAPIPSYPDSPAGLEKLMKGMLDLERHGDTNALAPYLQSLVLPNPDAWFKSIFGDTVGAQLALSYEPTAKGLPQAMAVTLKNLRQERFADHFEAVDSNKPCAAPSFMVVQSKSETDALGRFIGKPEIPASVGAQGPQPQVKSGGPVQAAKLIHGVYPVYPLAAKQAHVQGTILLSAEIGEDGSIQDLSYVSGPQALVSSAMHAVKQWTYQPMMLNGTPVSVDTCITVTFNLGSRRGFQPSMATRNLGILRRGLQPRRR